MELNPIISSCLRDMSSARLERHREVVLLERASRGDRAATDQLLRSHFGFIARMAYEFRGRDVLVEDLIAEGCIGYLRAIRRFDPRRGTRFMTYAMFWIRKAILEAIVAQPRVVIIPRYQRMIGRFAPRELRLDDHHAGNGGPTLGEGMADDRAIDPTDAVVQGDALRRLRAHLLGLPCRERTVLVLRFGLSGESPRTLKEAGAELGLSRERVRQIEVEALDRLRGLLAGKTGRRRLPRPVRRAQ